MELEEGRTIDLKSQLIGLEVTKEGKIIALTYTNPSSVIIYKENTYEEEYNFYIACLVNCMNIFGDYIYFGLRDNYNNILMISLKDYKQQSYLSYNCKGMIDVKGVEGGLVSISKEGHILFWRGDAVYKSFYLYLELDTVTALSREIIAVLSSKSRVVKFFDYRKYSSIHCLGTLEGVSVSSCKNNMMMLTDILLGISGTYLYIVDINIYEVVGKISTFLANIAISPFYFNEEKEFFISQGSSEEIGLLGYYRFEIENSYQKGTLKKLASRSKCHSGCIISMRKIEDRTVVTAGQEGLIKFWKIK